MQATRKMNRLISPILKIKLAAMATSLEPLDKERSLICDQIHIYNENLVKIVPLDREMICLQRFIFLKKMRWVYTEELLKLWSYWTEVHHILTQNS